MKLGLNKESNDTYINFIRDVLYIIINDIYWVSAYGYKATLSAFSFVCLSVDNIRALHIRNN